MDFIQIRKKYLKPIINICWVKNQPRHIFHNMKFIKTIQIESKLIRIYRYKLETLDASENISWISVEDALLQKSLLHVQRTPSKELFEGNPVVIIIFVKEHSMKYGLN